MTTRSDNAALIEILGDVNSFPMIADDIIYTRSAVGLVDASGHARPLTSADKFGGFCRKKADNSGGSAAALNVDVMKRVSTPVISSIVSAITPVDRNANLNKYIGDLSVSRVLFSVLGWYF